MHKFNLYCLRDIDSQDPRRQETKANRDLIKCEEKYSRDSYQQWISR